MLEVFAGCSALALVTWKTEVLSAKASLTAFIIGSLIWALNDPAWIFILVSFLVVGYAGTKWRYDRKKKIGVEEEENGTRNIQNILGNGSSPAFFAIISSPVGFAGSVSTAMADTLASEVGVFSKRARLITTWKKVEPGTNGAVSPLGTVFSAIGALFVAIIAHFLFGIGILAPFIGGFMGCHMDSILGATLERRGYMTKSEVNLAATFSGGMISLLVLLL
ncbi:MAG: DUF92 domain-containing protein [Candidatus Aenigmatarchaeota archaeon]